MENFGSGMVQFGSIRVSDPLSGEHISGVGSGMGPGCSVRVSGLGSVLPGLLNIIATLNVKSMFKWYGNMKIQR